MESLERIADLRDRGLLSDEEFEIKRQEILDASSHKKTQNREVQIGRESPEIASEGSIGLAASNLKRGGVVAGIILLILIAVVITLLLSNSDDSSESVSSGPETEDSQETESSSDSRLSSDQSESNSNEQGTLPPELSCLDISDNDAVSIRQSIHIVIFAWFLRHSKFWDHQWLAFSEQYPFWTPDESVQLSEGWETISRRDPEYYQSWFSDIGARWEDLVRARLDNWDSSVLANTDKSRFCEPEVKEVVEELHRTLDQIAEILTLQSAHMVKYEDGTYRYGDDFNPSTYEVERITSMVQTNGLWPNMGRNICTLQLLTPTFDLLEPTKVSESGPDFNLRLFPSLDALSC